jgi:hypothetical protein
MIRPVNAGYGGNELNFFGAFWQLHDYFELARLLCEGGWVFLQMAI